MGSGRVTQWEFPQPDRGAHSHLDPWADLHCMRASEGGRAAHWGTSEAAVQLCNDSLVPTPPRVRGPYARAWVAWSWLPGSGHSARQRAAQKPRTESSSFSRAGSHHHSAGRICKENACTSNIGTAISVAWAKTSQSQCRRCTRSRQAPPRVPRPRCKASVRSATAGPGPQPAQPARKRKAHDWAAHFTLCTAVALLLHCCCSAVALLLHCCCTAVALVPPGPLFCFSKNFRCRMVVAEAWSFAAAASATLERPQPQTRLGGRSLPRGLHALS
eukprot:364680-Chlamydomonas_euryale.AAC.4